ncbi:acetyltransferase [Aporhodopirellula aestuarii]|uniref:Acetyltransferase n=1 Tax=Aporhodopirellula aestuarii TaxID=2950107 RepID=A0ABT0UE77_9BACT|nr:acetyltransferase [Aporhodopirellula aestuarii]MCM2375020.1 acetyltransferase [Aporhodopirellula aestuarii]
MFLKEKVSGDLIRIDDLEELFSPHETVVQGRRQAGEEEQDTGQFSKSDLAFPSGEPLPQCWIDASYQMH